TLSATTTSTSFSSSLTLCPPSTTLFPYTTLFRSRHPLNSRKRQLLRWLIRGDIAFTFHASESLGRVKADPGQIEQVIMNLAVNRSEEHTSELQSPDHLVCRLLLEKKKKT